MVSALIPYSDDRWYFALRLSRSNQLDRFWQRAYIGLVRIETTHIPCVPIDNLIILLIDDDIDDGFIFREALSEVAPEVTFLAENKIITLLARIHNKKLSGDLIFLDINMPVCDGWEILTALKKSETYKNTPVILIDKSIFTNHESDTVFCR